MSPRALGRTWDEASSPEVLRLAGRFEAAWRDSSGARPDPSDHLPSDPRLRPAALLALLRTDLALRWQDGEAVAVEWYLRRHPDLGPETLMALAYEEFCLRAEAGERPDPAEYQARFPEVAAGLREVLDIHDLVVGAAGSSTALIGPSPSAAALPAAGQTIAGFHLVEELGRGAFARVFLAHERQLADRPVALKVTRLGSREPQTLAQLQHTHIVPVHSYRTDPATGLHLLCMPYFGHVTLAQILAETGLTEARSGSDLLAALDRLQGHRGFTAETAEIAERKTEAIRERKDEAIEKKRKGEFVGRNRTRILLRSHSLSFRSVFLSAFSASSAVKSSHVSGTSREVLAGRTYARVVAWLGARLAEALAHAHERGVLHRDVKPTNILVTADGLPMLLDFNLAHDPRDGAGGDGVRLGGTLAYMAPEHLEAMIAGEAEGIDHRADLYALGMVLFEALGGHPMSSASFAAGGAAAFD
ncbi:MAG TPA: serine/threonine-protein kinase, partial [Isosphaeraceae bacterium]